METKARSPVESHYKDRYHSISFYTCGRTWKAPVFLIFTALLLAACTQEPSSWNRIQEEGILRVGIDPTFPPFEATDGENLYGIDVELADSLANDLGLKAEFTYFGYDGLYDALLTEQIDVLISALAIFPELTRDFAYSEPYFNAGQVAVSQQSEQIFTLEDLTDQSVAVELGAEGHLLARDLQREKPAVTVLTFNSAEEALTALESGAADIAVTDSISAQTFNFDESYPESSVFLTDEPYAMVVRAVDKLLLEKLNDSLAKLKDSGVLNEIKTRWLSN